MASQVLVVQDFVIDLKMPSYKLLSQFKVKLLPFKGTIYTIFGLKYSQNTKTKQKITSKYKNM